MFLLHLPSIPSSDFTNNHNNVDDNDDDDGSDYYHYFVLGCNPLLLNPEHDFTQRKPRVVIT